MKIGKFVIITKKEYDRLQRDHRRVQTLMAINDKVAKTKRKRQDNERANREISSALSQLDFYTEVDA